MVKEDRSDVELVVVRTNINELAESAMKRLKPIARLRNIELTLVNKKEVFAEVDATRISQIMNNLVVNIIENSYGKPYIKMDSQHYEALRVAKRDNYAIIYNSSAGGNRLNTTVRPMMGQIYDQLLEDLKQRNLHSPIFTHHINYVNAHATKRKIPYGHDEHNQIVVDYIASMTDDYLVDLRHYLFPNSQLRVDYTGYFD
jgi:dGTPase